MIRWDENIKKSSKSDKSVDELLKDVMLFEQAKGEKHA
jgi:hypothetical protein